MELRFYLRNTTTPESAIYCYVTVDGAKVRFATPETILVKDWEKGFPKKINTTSGQRNRLSRIKVEVDQFIKENRQTISSIKIQNKIKTVINGENNGTDLTELFLKFSDGISHTATLKSRHPFYQKLFAFKLLIEINPDLQLNDIDHSLGERYIKMLQAKKYDNSNVNKNLKNIRTFFNWAFKHEFVNKQLSKYFADIKAQEKPIYVLNENEISILENAPLKPKFDRVRDLFLLSCYTGQRYSDIIEITKQSVNNSTWNFVTKKTKEHNEVSLLNEALTIIEKRNYDLNLSNQKANETLKELFKHLNLDRPVMTKDGLKNLNEVITYHTARKSFISLALNRGIQRDMVKQMSGHKSDKVFSRYVNFSLADQKNALEKMSKSARNMKVA